MDTVEMLFVTTVIGYRGTIARVFHLLHTLPPDMRVSIHLPSITNYRVFWQPVDERLYPDDPFIPISRQKKIPTGRFITVTNFFTSQQLCDVLVTINGPGFEGVKRVLRIQFTPLLPQELLRTSQRLFLVEDPYTVEQGTCDALQTNLKVKRLAFFRPDGLVMDVIATLIETKEFMGQGRPGKVGFVPNHFIVIVSSNLDIMYELYSAFHRQGVAVCLNVEDVVSQGACRKQSHNCSMPLDINVMVVQDSFKEMAALLTYATQVIVADTLVNPLVMQHMWALSFSVLVAVYRVDLRFPDGSKGFVESPEVLQLLYPHHSFHTNAKGHKVTNKVTNDLTNELTNKVTNEVANESLSLHCSENLPGVPILRFNSLTYPLCQLTLLELYAGVCSGAFTFSLLHSGMEVEGWLDYSLVFTMVQMFPNSKDPVPVLEHEITELWGVMCSGKQSCLSQIDWAALTTLLLCKVILPPTATLLIRRLKGEFEEFKYHQFCEEVTRGTLWGADLCTIDGDTVRLYDFSNSVALCSSGEDLYFNTGFLVPEINVFI